jgi:hypothetical protein
VNCVEAQEKQWILEDMWRRKEKIHVRRQQWLRIFLLIRSLTSHP